MNDNTILRIKVPAHLYESVKEQLTINEAKKSGHNYGAGMEIVKEKKMKTPKDGMKRVEENINEASVDPNLIGGIIGILFGSLPLLYKIIKDYRAAKTPEEKKEVLKNAAQVISGKMGGGSMKENKEGDKEVTNELFGFGGKGKYKEGDLVYFKLQGDWETSPRKISRVFKGGDGKVMYDLSTHETNGAYLKNGGYNTTEDNLKPAK